MSGPTIKQNLTPVKEPSLTDLLDLFKKQIMLNLVCHHVGTIQSFDATKQTAVCTVNYKKTYFKFDDTSQVYVPVLIDYPAIVDCPVVVLGGGNAALTFPIVKGDECILIFNDRDFDNWFQGQSTAPNATPRTHSFSDAIALVGIRSLAKSISGYDTTRAVLRNGTDPAMVAVGPTLIKIQNNSQNLNTLLQNLLTQLENLITQIAAITVTGVTTGPGASGPPANAAAITAISTQLSTIGTNIAGLLE